MKRNLILSLSVLLLTLNVRAEQKDSLRFNQERVYLGASVGMSAAEADFSSFGADKFRPGWGAGVNLGYRFSNVWSLELTAVWGQVFLAEQNCCLDRHYFLGSDINRYHPTLIPEGQSGHYYSDLISRTFVQRYGLQANMDILGFFESTRAGRWGLKFSPALYAVGTSSDIVTKTDKSPLAENISKWHFGYGAKIQATYAIAENLSVGVFGGYTQLTGKQLDGMPKLHTTNNIIDFGVTFTFGLKKSGKIRTAGTSTCVVPVMVPVCPKQPESDKMEEVADQAAPTEPQVQAEEVAAVPVQPAVEVVPEETAPEICMCRQKNSMFPVINFSFNSVWIEPDQRAKVKEIADKMKADKSICIRVTGWCDPVGSDAANQRVSLQRAEAVKRVLGQWLVPADRVEIAGGGVCRGAASNDDARCAIIEIL